jgi:hypothetical protein
VSCLGHVSGLKTLNGRVKEVGGYLRTGKEAPGRTAPFWEAKVGGWGWLGFFGKAVGLSGCSASHHDSGRAVIA